jgi:hypothetical protein
VLAGFVMGPLVGFRIIRDPVVAFVSVLFLPIIARADENKLRLAGERLAAAAKQSR